jgi:benzylsuccinate CoA-transferase BbsF subunit
MAREAFEKLNILDFGWAVAVPWTLKYLADHGATVVHVESTQHPDFLRTGPPFKGGRPDIDNSYYFSNYHCNKYGLRLNMRHPKARGIVEKLIAWADVLVENFSPGVMKKWGFSYEEVQKIKPDLVMLSSSQLGQEGPIAPLPGSGIQLAPYAGFNYLTGWKDREPSVLYGGFTDCPGGRFGAVILIAALLYRRRTGRGIYIDLSQHESSLHLLAPVLMDYHVNGRIAVRDGNRHPQACPHGTYPCKGDDRWCAITVFTDGQWEGLKAAMGDPQWAKDPKFSMFSDRKKNEDDLNRRISEWTVKFTPQEILFTLQKAKIPAGVVQTSEDLYGDPQLAHVGYFEKVNHPRIGEHWVEAQAFRLSKTPHRLRSPAPCMGEHNECICREILQYSDEEFIDLLNEGVFE